MPLSCSFLDQLSVTIFNMTLFVLLGLICLHPSVSSAMGLVLGLIFGFFLTHPWPELNRRYLHHFLAVSIVGIGFGMDLNVLGQVGLHGIGYTFLGILFSMLLGLLLGRFFSVPKEISLLVSSGTAICGGSAIAAVASVLRSKPADVSSALIIVFVLNSVALIIFPFLGHFFALDESQFGLWSALAIHDTSSVVGATLQYGPQALIVGTTVKLARALWIVPLALSLGLIYPTKNKEGQKLPFKKPWFILGFIVAAAVVTWIPTLKEPGQWIAFAAKRLFVITLFLIGSGFNRENLKSMSLRPFAQAVTLWVIVATAYFTAVYFRFLTPGF
jgi:uncharacterized integral membrane protein (TIGR00698 family)